MSTGLQINDTNVEFLSGPISCTLLFPIKYTEYQKKGLELPIVLLFGDQHGSYESMCNFPSDNPIRYDGNCDATQGCYKIYSQEFLQALDKMAENTYPIDIYAETHRKGIDSQSYGPMYDFIQGNRTCFLGDIQHTNIGPCGTKNIRWHYSDVRVMHGGLISHLIDFLVTIMYMRETGSLSSEQYRTEIDQKMGREYFTTIISILRTFLPESGSDGKIKEVIYEIFQNLDPTDKIMKQIDSQIPEFRSVGFWADLLIESFYQSPEKRKSAKIPNLEDMNFVLDCLEEDSIEVLLSTPNVINVLLQFERLILYTTSGFMDIYAILRMFKKPSPKPYHIARPTDKLNPTLSVCYFGYQHCVNLSYILRSILSMYDTIVDYQPAPYLDRCINFTVQPFNLSGVVAYVNRLRKQPIKFPDEVEEEELRRLAYYRSKYEGAKRRNRYKKYLFRE